MFKYNDSKWSEIKNIFYPLAVVDMNTYNYKTGECRVDFLKHLSSYSIKGSLLFKGEFPTIVVNNEERLYVRESK